jgi:hypothetical protein
MTPLKAARERVENWMRAEGPTVLTVDIRTLLAALDEQAWRTIAVGQQVVSSRGSLGVRNADDYFSPALLWR